MRFHRVLLVLIIALSTLNCATTHTKGSYDRTLSVFHESPVVAPFFKNAYGYAVFPTIGKGGLVIGGAYGNGQVYRQGVATGKSSLVKMSVGFQLGGQAFSEIFFF